MRRRGRGSLPDEGWTSEVSSGFALAGFLGLVFVAFTLLAMGPLVSLDASLNLGPPPRSLVPVLHVMDRMGQRAVCLPVLVAVAFWMCRRLESWRPGVVAVVSVFMLNLVVGILKIGFGRAEPVTANPAFFSGGLAYPSGHSSNVLLVYGLTVFLLSRYHEGIGRRTLAVLWCAVGVLSVGMVFTSLTLHWHWFADLIGGLIVGGIVLQLTISVNRVLPTVDLAQGWLPAVRTTVATLRGTGSPPTPPDPAAVPTPPDPATVSDLPQRDRV